MIHSVSGKLIAKKPELAVIETGGIGFKILIGERTGRGLPKIGGRLKLFCHLHSTENGISLFGFPNEAELQIFELLTAINGIGPKAALRVLGAMKPEKLLAAIKAGRSDLLVKAAGVGAKKANRIILELKGKVSPKSKLSRADAENESKLGEMLRSLGYKKEEIVRATDDLSPKLKTLEQKLKAALKNLT